MSPIMHAFKTGLSQLATNKVMQLLLLVMAMLMANDFADRIYISSDNDDVAAKLTASSAGSLPKADAALAEQIKALLLPYDKQAQQALAQSDKPKKPSIDIDAQQGQLTKVFTASYELSLKGVIDDNGRYALVQAKSREGGGTTWLKLTPGQQVDGFTITALELTRIRLERGGQLIELQMYAPLSGTASQQQVPATASSQR